MLESGYDYPKSDIVSLLQRILATKQFDIPQKNLVWRALDDYKNNSVDFADCLIGQINSNEGAEVTVTFDRALKKLAYFKVLENI